MALVNRLLLPWYTSDYALEQLADALEQAALLFGSVYESQLERMRLAEIVAGQLKQQGPEALQVHINAAPASSEALAAPALGSPPANNSPACPPAEAAGCGVSPVQALAACEAAEAKLLVVLRQQVLSRLVAVQLSLAKESVSWRRGVLATPPLVLNVLGAMNAVKEALASQRLALAPFTKHGATAMTEQPGPGAAGPGTGMLHTMQHCYSMWALPLHPLWLEVGCLFGIINLLCFMQASTACHATYTVSCCPLSAQLRYEVSVLSCHVGRHTARRATHKCPCVQCAEFPGACCLPMPAHNLRDLLCLVADPAHGQ